MGAGGTAAMMRAGQRAPGQGLVWGGGERALGGGADNDGSSLTPPPLQLGSADNPTMTGL